MLNLPRDEMAFRSDYEELLLNQSLTTVFRPGNRLYPNWRGYEQGEIITGRIIERCGCDIKNIPPLFKNLKILLKIAKIEILFTKKLNTQDFEGSSADVVDIDSLDKHISAIYNKSLSEYDNTVTRIVLEYLDQDKHKLTA